MQVFVDIAQICAAVFTAWAAIIAFQQLRKKNDDLIKQNELIKSNLNVQQQAFLVKYRPRFILIEPTSLQEIEKERKEIQDPEARKDWEFYVFLHLKGSPAENLILKNEDNHQAFSHFLFVPQPTIYPDSGLAIVTKPKRYKFWPGTVVFSIQYDDAVSGNRWEQTLIAYRSSMVLYSPSLVKKGNT